MNTTARHLSDDVLEEYAMGKLPDPEVAPIEEHLLLCPTCRERLGDVDEFVQVAQAALKASIHPPPLRLTLRIPIGHSDPREVPREPISVFRR